MYSQHRFHHSHASVDHLIHFTVEAISQAAPIPNRANEDAFVTQSKANTFIAAVMDGASRPISTKGLAQLPKQYEGEELSLAGWAARITADVISEADAATIPVNTLLRANKIIGQHISSIYDATSTEVIFRQEPDIEQAITALLENLETLKHPAPENSAYAVLSKKIAPEHLVRLLLPVACASMFKIDWQSQTFEWVHAGDTAIFLFHHNDEITRLTSDKMERHDNAALQIAKEHQLRNNLHGLKDALTVPGYRIVNLLNAIYHNYLDTNGNPDSELGVGVINGLSSLSYYIESGRGTLEGISGIFICSDGFLPAEDIEETIRDQINREGLSGYYRWVCNELDNDPGFNTYMRGKHRDDMTGIYINLGDA